MDLHSLPGLTPIVAALGILSFIALLAIGIRLFLSARSADDHIARGVALTPPPADPEAARAAGLSAYAVAPAGPLAAAAPDRPSRQIFAQLNQYYAANISQGNTIFWSSLLAMCIGFAIIFIGVISANGNSTTAIVATIAGVLSQFIAATFLVVLRSTQQQATTYAQTLVELHLRDVTRTAEERDIALGVKLLGEISADRTDPANTAKAAIAVGLMVRSGRSEPAAVTVELPKNGASSTSEFRARGATVTFEGTAADGAVTPGAEKR